MSINFTLKLLDSTHKQEVYDLADKIYANEKLATEKAYPGFRIGYDVDKDAERYRYFSMFMLEPKFKDFNLRRCYGAYDNNDNLIAVLGVRRHNETFPAWSFCWILSPHIGARFIVMFRQIIDQLCKIHEEAGMKEFYVTYPADREEVYSKIMLPLRERYYTFVETTVKRGEISAYPFVTELIGRIVQPYDINLRRYILRRENTEPESQGGKRIRIIKEAG